MRATYYRKGSRVYCQWNNKLYKKYSSPIEAKAECYILNAQEVSINREEVKTDQAQEQKAKS